ncbi:hypothetical protein LTR66_004335 [Elasticomyces elasticus]|nr:hypothetical protein LTR66_004335 [Elasticomyces elasticus]
MIGRTFRSSLHPLRSTPRSPLGRLPSRPISTPSPPPPPPPPPPASRISRINARLPRFLQRYTEPLRNAPISHITAFLLLHELTAVLPLFGLAAAFHYTNWLPPYISEGQWVAYGVEKFGKWMRKKGWIDELGEDGKQGRVGRWWGRGEGGVRVVVELATAYAITKALLPVRLVFSVWATPWFARYTVLPVTEFVRKIFRRNRKKPIPSVAAGPGVAGTGVLGAASKGDVAKKADVISRPPKG